MGTNYYLRIPRCSCCGHQDDGLHIGKSSCGWRFTFNGTLNTNIEAWRKAIASTDVCIYDEEGTCVSKSAFWRKVEENQVGKALHHDLRDDYSFVDYDFS